MRIPNAKRAVVEVGKLADYCLNPRHPRGRHKARVFAAKLGISAAQADILRQALLNAARTRADAAPAETDRFGQRYVLDFDMSGPKGSARVRSMWIVRKGEDFARLSTCYVL